MFNKMKRFMAILLSLTMLLSAMPMNALAETFSSGWTSAVDDGISLLADGDQNDPLCDSSRGNHHH